MSDFSENCLKFLSLDDSGNPVLDDSGKPVFKVDASGNPLFKVDASGNPLLDASGNPLFKVDPLIYLSGVDLSGYTNLLLIDKSVADYQDFITYANPQTFTVAYSSNSSRDDLLALVYSGFSNLNRIGLVFETNDNGRVYSFLDRELWFTEKDLGVSEDFSPNLAFMISLVKTLGIKNIDYLACNTLQFDHWVKYYSVLTEKTGVVIGASNDKTGNIKYGGDWVMESTGTNVEKVYFTSGIEYHRYLLASNYTVLNYISGGDYTNPNDFINTSLNTVIFDIYGNVGTFTNTGVVLGGGGSAGGVTGLDGAHALIVKTGKTVTKLVNTGSLTGGGGGGNGSYAGAGGAGGGGGGSGLNNTYGNGGNGGGGNFNNRGIHYDYYIGGGGGYAGGGGGFGGGGGGAWYVNGVIASNGNGSVGGAGNGPGGNSGVGASGGYNGGGGGGANSVNIFGGSGGYITSLYSGGGGAGGGNGSGGGSGGGYGYRSGSVGGNGGFGIKNYGNITTLSNAQNLSGNYGPLYIAGNAPTNYNIIIQSDDSYGQLFASPNSALKLNNSNGSVPTSGNYANITFGIDPSSNLSTGTKIYTNVLSCVTPINKSGSIMIDSNSYAWLLNKNTITQDANNPPNKVINYNLTVKNIPNQSFFLILNDQFIDFDMNNNGIINIGYYTEQISGVYYANNLTLDLSLNNVTVDTVNSENFDLTPLRVGDNSLNLLVTKSNLSTSSYFVKIHKQNNDTTLKTFTLNGIAVTDGDTVNLANGTTSVSVVATPTDSNAVYTVSGSTGLKLGNNTLTVIVSAEDRSISETYTVTLIVKSLDYKSYVNNITNFDVNQGNGDSSYTQVNVDDDSYSYVLTNPFMFNGYSYSTIYITGNGEIGFLYNPFIGFIRLADLDSTNYPYYIRYKEFDDQFVVIYNTYYYGTTNKFQVKLTLYLTNNVESGKVVFDFGICENNSEYTQIGFSYGGYSYNNVNLLNPNLFQDPNSPRQEITNNQNSFENKQLIFEPIIPIQLTNLTVDGNPFKDNDIFNIPYGLSYVTLNFDIFNTDPNVSSYVVITVNGTDYGSQTATATSPFTATGLVTGINNITLLVSSGDNLTQKTYHLTLTVYVEASCLLEGTLVWTNKGYLPIETLKPGDIIETKNFFIEITKVGKWSVDLNREEDRNDLSKKMYKIPAGKYGAKKDTYISHYHRILFYTNPDPTYDERVYDIPINLGLQPAEPEVFAKDGKYNLYHLQIAKGNHYVVNGECMVEAWNQDAKNF